MKSFKSSIFIGTIILLLMIFYIYISKQNENQFFYKSDEIYIEKSINLWSIKNESDKEKSMRDRYPVALHFPKEVCVELRLKKGAVGGSPIYCFTRDNKTLVKSYENFE